MVEAWSVLGVHFLSIQSFKKSPKNKNKPKNIGNSKNNRFQRGLC